MANINITQGQLDNVVTAINNRAKTSVVETRTSAMTKAQFNALAEERKANRAGSGFDSFGWGSNAVPSTDYIINEGLWVRSNVPNVIHLSRSDAAAKGTSKSKIPIVNVNGVQHKIFDNGGDRITLPTAQNIYPYDTVLTTEQINSGVIKHADSSNSGLIVNGKFDTDTSGWTALWNCTLSNDKGRLKATSTVESGYMDYNQAFTTVVGKKYVVECLMDKGNSYDIQAYIRTGTGYGTTILVTPNSTFEFTATSTITNIAFRSYVTALGQYSYIDNIAVYQADAISRSDLVFLESFHEDISEKNFVYPLGNVQYLGGNTEGLTGIANGSFTGFETYSLLGNWQTSSALIGKGYVWSSLTEAQKRAFIANPDNNCYLDGDKVIQVRYRVRVVQGWGDSYYASGLLYYNNYTGRVYTDNDWLKPKGKLVNITSDLASYDVNETGYYSKVNTPFLESTDYASDYGILVAISKADNAYEVNTSYSGRNFAILLASGHRRNQGMYHPVYNPNGTKKAVDGNFWYNTAISFTSISDCFDQSKLLVASGYIGTVSGRPDGLFYDQVHESDITDLRNSSKKVEDYNRLMTREFNKLVAGTNRGRESEWITGVTFGTTNLLYDNGGVNITIYDSNFLGASELSIGDSINVAYYNGSAFIYDRATVTTPSNQALMVNAPNIATSISGGVLRDGIKFCIYSKRTKRTKSNTLLHCDIIGNPSNYPASWKQSGVFGTPLIVAEDGTSLLPDGARDTFKLSRKANATPLLCLRSTDSGATWTSFTPTFSTTTNAITLTDEPAGNLVMVYYQTHTSMAVPVVNSEVLEIGDVWGNVNLAYTQLASSLCGKILIGDGEAGKVVSWSTKLSEYTISGNTKKFSALPTYSQAPSHPLPTLPLAGTLGIKVFPYLTRTNGKAYLNLVFKEMKHNGTSLGDSGKFEIVDNVSTATDNNAQTVLIGQKTVELPYFIDAGE